MNISQNWLTRLIFGLFIGWMMSFPYEGPLLYAFAEHWVFDGVFYNSISVALVATGMLGSALCVRSHSLAKQVMSTSVLLSFMGAALMMFLPQNLILLVLMTLAFLSGIFVPAWGYFYFYNTPAIERGKAVADVLIIGNLILTVSAVLSTWSPPWIGMLFCVLILAGCLWICSNLGLYTETDCDAVSPVAVALKNNFRLPFTLFLGFIFFISLTSGIMFQVVYPYFSSFTLLSSLYTNFPYMLALFALRTMPQSINKNFTLYIGMSILGISYMLFAFMPEGITKFFLVMTPMLAAYGIFDYFWWRIMGDLCPYGYTPAFVIGLSLATNVFGVFCGGLMSLHVMEQFHLKPSDLSFFALGFAFIIIALLPVLNAQMGRLLSRHIFFIHYSALPDLEKESVLEEQHTSELLTDRETEIVNLVLSGMTFKSIAETLFISENTVKTHTKNIYKKLGIKSKFELIKRFS